ncbi:MAG: hypothetical protein SPL08_00760 [Pseudomonadota bacterium]|nr:hypothetical protein [Pseudomonadota bacterium]
MNYPYCLLLAAKNKDSSSNSSVARPTQISSWRAEDKKKAVQQVHNIQKTRQ